MHLWLNVLQIVFVEAVTDHTSTRNAIIINLTFSWQKKLTFLLKDVFVVKFDQWILSELIKQALLVDIIATFKYLRNQVTKDAATNTAPS